jgi:hypothetical protein
MAHDNLLSRPLTSCGKMLSGQCSSYRNPLQHNQVIFCYLAATTTDGIYSGKQHHKWTYQMMTCPQFTALHRTYECTADQKRIHSICVLIWILHGMRRLSYNKTFHWRYLFQIGEGSGSMERTTLTNGGTLVNRSRIYGSYRCQKNESLHTKHHVGPSNTSRGSNHLVRR